MRGRGRKELPTTQVVVECSRLPHWERRFTKRRETFTTQLVRYTSKANTTAPILERRQPAKELQQIPRNILPIRHDLRQAAEKRKLDKGDERKQTNCGNHY